MLSSTEKEAESIDRLVDDHTDNTTLNTTSISSNTTANSNKNISLTAHQIEARRNFTKKENLRRSVFKEITTFGMFPLQAMAMDDYDIQMKDYINIDNGSSLEGGACGIDDDSDIDSDNEVPKRMVHADNKQSKKLSVDDECDVLRQQFMQEFMKEKHGSITVPNVEEHHAAVASSDVNESTAEENTSTHTSKNAPLAFDNKENLEEINIQQKDTDEYQVQKDMLPTNNQSLSTLWSLEPRLFAMETAMKGKRRYISTHLGRFMDHYWRECDVYNRHYYELIKENSPCRLYFDLEFNKHSNPELTPTITEELLTELFDELCYQFQLVYKITITCQCLVDLDSSTSKKFSRHWILHLPNEQLFSDAREVGIFVKVFVSRLEEEEKNGKLQSRGHTLLANNLFVNAESDSKKDDGTNNPPKLTRFIDLGVYTRNRIFRLLGSTKHGKPPDAALRIAEANQFPFPNSFDNTKFYFPMMNKQSDDNNSTDEKKEDDNNTTATIQQDDDFRTFCESFSWENHATALAATLVVPANASKMQYPILKDPSSLLSDDEKQQFISLRPLNGVVASNGSTSLFPRPAASYGASPFLKLEHFILNTLGKRKGLVGSIGTWSIDNYQQPLPQTVTFNMKDNRYCDNIGRAHKSNNIIWNVHLIDRVCHQSCHDPECRRFRGKPIDLPEEVNTEIDEYFLDYELSKLNENVASGQQDDDGEFDDPLLESAMRQLDIIGVSQTAESSVSDALDDEALDDELANLNLSEIVSSKQCLNSQPSHSENKIDETVSASTTQTKSTEHIESDHSTKLYAVGSVDDLDSVLEALNLLEA